MRSPFAIFRKHQKILLVVLTGLAMFAFIFLDQIQQSGGRGLMPLLGLMLGAGVFWVIGTQTGKSSSFAVVGAVLGLGLGILGPRLGGPAAAVETRIGDLSQPQLAELVSYRRLANNFVVQAFRQANPLPPNMPGSANFIEQILMGQLEQFRFQLLPNSSEEQDVVFGYLLRHEAKNMDVLVGDEVIQEFIQQISTPTLFNSDKGPLTTDEFRELRSRFQITETELFDILRDELQAKLMRDLLAPSDILSPDQHWQDYRKINVRQVLEVEAVAVRPFADAIKEPSQDDLLNLFNQYKAVVPYQAAFGFRQRRKVKLAYLEADYETVESSLPEITDQLIENYYEENKDGFYKVLAIPEMPETTEESTDSTGDVTIPESPESRNKPVDAEKPSPGSSAASSKTGTDSTGSDSTGSDSTGSDSTKPEVSTQSDPAREARQSDLIQDAPTPSRSGNESERDVDKQLRPKSSQEQSLREYLDRGDGSDQLALAFFSSSQDAAATAKSKPKVEDERVEQQQTGQLPPAPALPRNVVEETGPKYRRLDDDLKSEIRDQLLEQRTKQAMEEKINAALTKLNDLAYRNRATRPTEQGYLTATEVSDKLKQFGEQNGLRYVVTKLLSATELRDAEDHSIGRATLPTGFPASSAEVPTVVDMIFGNDSEQLYSEQKAVDFFNTQNLFAYWVIADIPAHIPVFDEEGVKGQVLDAWKILQGRPKAQKRAEELAELVREAIEKDKTMSVALKDQTLTGDPDGMPLPASMETPEFSWLTTSSTPQLNPLQPSSGSSVRLSSIVGIENVSNDFMKAVFELGKNEVRVISNQDLSVYYVVQLKRRIPARGAELALQERFFQDDLFSRTSPYRYLSNVSQSAGFIAWSNAFERQFVERWDLQR